MHVSIQAITIDEEDFTRGVWHVTFPADEHEDSIITAVSVDVPIEDDDLDESLQQHFIATLELVNASSLAQAVIPSDNNISLCTIRDNDNGMNIRTCVMLMFTYTVPFFL